SEQRQLLEDWSQWAFDRAQAILRQGDLNQAILTARRIPPNSPLAATASTAIETWQTQWQQAEQLEAAFEQAIVAQQWQSALSITYQLAQSPLLYWRNQRADELLKRLRYTRNQYPQAAPSPVP
ncbi:MAG: hypothetical protein F6J87_10170, partial [Spirulina sp. SIO3F2]|nr:hypothetical protein [Spirulina sp. SIO3F2]